jgi:hypothetical protein
MIILSAPFTDTSEETVEVEANVICEIEATSYTVGADTSYDRYVFATNGGLVVVNSDLSYKIYTNIKSVNDCCLIGDYAYVGGTMYKLTGDDAIMIPTSSKGTAGSLGIAKHNVRAGETGTAIVLFS